MCAISGSCRSGVYLSDMDLLLNILKVYSPYFICAVVDVLTSMLNTNCFFPNEFNRVVLVPKSKYDDLIDKNNYRSIPVRSFF